MKTLTLTPEQAELLKDTLNSYLSDLRMEISDTDSFDFKERLKSRKEILTQILAILESN